MIMAYQLCSFWTKPFARFQQRKNILMISEMLESQVGSEGYVHVWRSKYIIFCNTNLMVSNLCSADPHFLSLFVISLVKSWLKWIETTNSMKRSWRTVTAKRQGWVAALGNWTSWGHRMEFRMFQLCRFLAKARQQGPNGRFMAALHL